jgi:hypothetical protein
MEWNNSHRGSCATENRGRERLDQRPRGARGHLATFRVMQLRFPIAEAAWWLGLFTLASAQAVVRAERP